jgi:hypothetical protein
VTPAAVYVVSVIGAVWRGDLGARAVGGEGSGARSGERGVGVVNSPVEKQK